MIRAARCLVRANEHCHPGIGYNTPADFHCRRAATVQQRRPQVLDAAHVAHPERFVRKQPESPKLPAVSWINPPPDREDNATTQ